MRLLCYNSVLLVRWRRSALEKDGGRMNGWLVGTRARACVYASAYKMNEFVSWSVNEGVSTATMESGVMLALVHAGRQMDSDAVTRAETVALANQIGVVSEWRSSRRCGSLSRMIDAYDLGAVTWPLEDNVPFR